VSAVPVPLRPAAGRKGRHLRVVEEPPKRHTLLYALLLIAITGATVFGTVALNAMAAGDSVSARQLDAAVIEAEREYARLVADVAQLEDPARIRQAARRLGMVQADAPRYLPVHRSLPADGAVTDPVTAGETTDPLKPVLSVER
jgi:hypothetical protein